MSSETRTVADDTPTVVVEAYLEFLDECPGDRGESRREASFEDFCARHDEISDALREIHRQWDFVESVLETAGLGSSAGGDGPSVADRTERLAWNRAFLDRLSTRGELLERYELRGILAHGGMATVWRVWDRDLDRLLAMKILDEDEPGTPPAEGDRRLARFLDEARIAAQLNHPGIPPIHEIGIGEEGCVYFTMKLVEGRTLHELIRDGREDGSALAAQEGVSILLKICDAMAYSHAKGVLHRDLKPSNVMVGRFGEVYVVDWGLARARAAEDPAPFDADAPALREALTETLDREVIGTPAYMSPEQASGRTAEVDARTDVYAVGAILYHLLAGVPPYHRAAPADIGAVLDQVRTGAPTPLHELAPALSGELQSICEKAMARSPGERYESMRELADDLRAYLEGRVVRAFRTGPLAELQKWVSRHRLLAASIAVGATLVASASAVGFTVHARAAATRRTLELHATQARIQELIGEVDRLWPPRPEWIDDYARWTSEAHGRALEWESRHAGQLEELRARAGRVVADAGGELGEAHFRAWSQADLESQLAALRRAQEVRAGSVPPPEPAEVIPDAHSGGPEQWLARAYPMVHPTRARTGAETLGWALALRALEQTRDDELRAEALAHVAWATSALGLDEQALAAALESYETSPDRRRRQLVDRLRAAAAPDFDHSRAIEELEQQLLALRTREERERTWQFADPADQGLHDQLASIAAGIERLTHPEHGLLAGLSPESGRGVQSRLAFARAMQEDCTSSRELHRRWDEVLDDLRRQPVYEDVDLSPHLDLYPVGKDPRTGLWEFAHLQTGNPAGRAADGRLILLENTAAILVLIPGGEFTRPLRDLSLEQTVQVRPFFLSKYELTQGQWMRLTGENPSRFTPGYSSGGEPIDLVHPVEEVSWHESRRVLRWAGLTHPTEAQWEYAARAGTLAGWVSGDDPAALQGAANLGGLDAGLAGLPGPIDPFDLHSAAGAFGPNSFGLHDVNGNVREWCLDAVQTGYRRWQQRVVDPVVHPDESRWRARLYRVVRGGGFESDARQARFEYRDRESPDFRAPDLGVRPARALDAW